MVHTTCAVKDCKSSSRINKELKFHQFPHTEERCKLWIAACGRPDLVGKTFDSLKNTYICSLHFLANMYGKKSLKKTAAPVSLLPIRDTHSMCTQSDTKIDILNNKGLDFSKNLNILKPKLLQEEIEGSSSRILKLIDEKVYDVNNSSQTQTKLTDHTTRKRKLRKQLFKTSKKLKFSNEKYEDITQKQLLKGCEKFLTPQLGTIVKAQIYLKPHCKNIRYTREFELFCLNMYCTSPLSYRFLLKTNCVPSKSTLTNMYIPISTKINEQMWEVLKASVKGMSPSDRQCIVCMDKMSLKCSLFYDNKQDKIVGLHEVNNEQLPYAARYAFTIMLRGIISNWKQPIGVSFISTSNIDEQLHKWIINTVKKLFSLGFHVRGFVSNLGSDFFHYSKLLGISKETCNFEIDGRKLYYIFDVPHLIKCVRNNLFNNNYEFENRIVKWDDIQNLYDLDKTKDKRCAHRLTDAHLMPNTFQKQKVRFATQIFSNSVKTALETYVASGSLKVADGTIEFIAFMNDLLDLLNSSNVYSPKPFNKAFNGDDGQTELLNKARNMFHNLSVKNKTTGRDVTKKLKFLDAFLVTINSISQLHSDMKCENFEYLLTRRFNNDCLESFFGIIRQANGHCSKPTCIQFMRAFRKSFLFQLMKLCNETKCTEDLDNILMKYNVFLKNKPIFSSAAAVSNDILPKICPDYYLSEKDAFLYIICGYLLRRCMEKHKCIAMIKYASLYDKQTTLENLYMRRKAYSTKNDPFIGLQVPPDDFVEYCQKLEDALKETFTTFVGNSIGIQLYQRLSEINFTTKPCLCFPSQFMIKLFIRMRIYYIIKFNNRNLKTNKSRYRKYLSVSHLQ